MTPEQIIQWAKEAGFVSDVMLNPLTRFAALVAAHEREQCAKVCEQYAENAKKRIDPTDYLMGQIDGAEICELYINARKP